MRNRHPFLIAVLGVTLAVLAAVGGASARRSDSSAFVNWASFGNTVDQNRYSPLTSITSSNVAQLGRAFTVDLNKFVPGIKKGQQTYPIVDNGVMYITSGDDQVFAVDATNGNLLWHYTPDNNATFKNFGIVANRGVAVCDNRVFLLTLDMTIVSLDPATGQQLARVPIADTVPGAVSNYGYSETSAPICADHHLIIGAAGSEYGARGFVMAYNTPSLTPAWANPFWTIPPDNTEWRTAARIVGGGVVWTPTTVDLTHQHALHRHGRRHAAVLPIAAARSRSTRRLADRARPDHRDDEVVAAAALVEPVVVRRLPAADGLHSQGRREDRADRLGGVDGRRMVCI